MNSEQEKALAVILDHAREALGDEVAARIQRSIDGRIEAALMVARGTMQNEYYDRPRIGLEKECAIVDAALAGVSIPKNVTEAYAYRPEPHHSDCMVFDGDGGCSCGADRRNDAAAERYDTARRLLGR